MQLGGLHRLYCIANTYYLVESSNGTCLLFQSTSLFCDLFQMNAKVVILDGVVSTHQGDDEQFGLVWEGVVQTHDLVEGIHHGGSGVLSLNVGQVAGIHHAHGELERHGCGEIPKKEKLLF